LRNLLEGIVISPWATPDTVEEIHLWVKHKQHSYPVVPSELESGLLPAFDDFVKYGSL
jgi:hypothetical protein